MQFFAFTAVAALIALVVAHKGPHERLSHSEIVRRSGISKRCEAGAAAMNSKRWLRHKERRSLASRFTSVVITTESPYYEHIQNDTCVTTPEVSGGPYYWASSQTLRQDMTEDQVGVPLYLDIGVLNTKTCEPLENVLVDLWQCNSTGSYSSFELLSPNTPVLELLAEHNLTIVNNTFPTAGLVTGNTTWLRGMWPTDSNGMMEMQTIFPGFYVQRSIHVHVELHTNWILRDNGTVVADETVNTAQMYFDEALTEQIMALEPYSLHTQINRTTNAIDPFFAQGAVDGYNPIMSVIPLDGEDVTKGMVAYITLGVEV